MPQGYKHRPRRNLQSVLSVGARMDEPGCSFRSETQPLPARHRDLTFKNTDPATAIAFAAQEAVSHYHLWQSEAFLVTAVRWLNNGHDISDIELAVGRACAEEALIGPDYEKVVQDNPWGIKDFTGLHTLDRGTRHAHFHLAAWAVVGGNLRNGRQAVRHYLTETARADYEDHWVGLALAIGAYGDPQKVNDLSSYAFRAMLNQHTRSALQVDAVESGKAPLPAWLPGLARAVRDRHPRIPRAYGVLAPQDPV